MREGGKGKYFATKEFLCWNQYSTQTISATCFMQTVKTGDPFMSTLAVMRYLIAEVRQDLCMILTAFTNG